MLVARSFCVIGMFGFSCPQIRLCLQELRCAAPGDFVVAGIHSARAVLPESMILFYVNGLITPSIRAVIPFRVRPPGHHRSIHKSGRTTKCNAPTRTTIPEWIFCEKEGFAASLAVVAGFPASFGFSTGARRPRKSLIPQFVYSHVY